MVNKGLSAIGRLQCHPIDEDDRHLMQVLDEPGRALRDVDEAGLGPPLFGHYAVWESGASRDGSGALSG